MTAREHDVREHILVPRDNCFHSALQITITNLFMS